MLSTEEVAYEPPTAKIYKISNAIFAMAAGDTSIQGHILLEVRSIVKERIQREPNNWWLVPDVAELWRQAYVRLRDRAAAAAILEPLGLTLPTYLAQQKHLSSEIVAPVADQLQRYAIGGCATIIAGVDELGPHIYRVDNTRVPACMDHVGFAAVGNGENHASSQLMYAKYGSTTAFPEALLLTYMAKRRADEVAPGVGRETDIHVVGPMLGNNFPVRPDRVQELDRMYQQLRKRERAAFADAKIAAAKWHEELAAATQPTVEQVQPPSTEAPTLAPPDAAGQSQPQPDSKDGP